MPGFDTVLTYGLLAPVGTPQPIIEGLNPELRAALAGRGGAERLNQEKQQADADHATEHTPAVHRSRGNQMVDA